MAKRRKSTRKSAHMWQAEDSTEANARQVLPAMAREYFAAGRKAVTEKWPPGELHEFRLATKRFRYTLEMFRDVYGPTLEKKLGQLKPVQNALGAVNDCVATGEAFDLGKAFGRYLEQLGEKRARAFYRAWRTKFDVKGGEERWVRYLSRVPEARSGGGSRLSEAKATIDGQHLAGNEMGTGQEE